MGATEKTILGRVETKQACPKCGTMLEAEFIFWTRNLVDDEAMGGQIQRRCSVCGEDYDGCGMVF